MTSSISLTDAVAATAIRSTSPLLLAGEAILETPPTTAGRRDLQIQAAAVELADGFLLSGGILN